MKKTTLTLNERELDILDLALRGYLEGIDGPYENEHVAMSLMRARIQRARRRLASKN